MQLTKQVNVRITGDDLSTLMEEADRQKISLSELLRTSAIRYAKQLRSQPVVEAADIDGIDGIERDGTRIIPVKLYPRDLNALSTYAIRNEFDALSDAVRGAARRGLVDRGYLQMYEGQRPDLEQ